MECEISFVRILLQTWQSVYIRRLCSTALLHTKSVAMLSFQNNNDDDDNNNNNNNNTLIICSIFTVAGD
jgi:hypothetical protein